MRSSKARRTFLVTLVLAPLLVTVAGQGTAFADVSSVSGSAFGFYTNVGLFGGPQSTRGPSPTVTLPSAGGNVSASDPDGDVGQYGPARIFESHGLMSVSTSGSTGASGSVTSTASVNDIQPQDPFTAAGPTNGVSSTCTTNESGSTGSTTITNGRLVLKDPNTDISGEPGEVVVVPPTNPAPGTEYSGDIPNVGDFYRIVFNEQVWTADGLTVNGAHMYILGPTAIGDMIISQSKCGVAATSANQAPVATNDAYTGFAGQALTIPAAGLLANDSDPEAGALKATKTLPIPPPTSGGGAWTFPSDPANGALTLSSNGSFTYVPDPGFVGIDSFSYTTVDPRGKTATATATITVNAPPSALLTINNVTINEGDAEVTAAGFTITRSGNLSGSTTVSYKTTNGTATTAGGDYAAVPLTQVTFLPGETTKPVNVNVNGDTLPEAHETFNVVLSSATGGAIVTDTTGVGTIVNDDANAFLSVDDLMLPEGGAGPVPFTFTITRTGNTTGTTTVKYKTTNGTATDVSGDYTPIPLTTVTFAPGETTKPVTVNVTGDTVTEADEAFTLTLSAPVGGVLSDTSGTATIINDEFSEFTVDDVWITEGNSGTSLLTFTVTRLGNISGPASVKVNTVAGTAVTPGDFINVPLTTLNFVSGDAAKTVTVSIVGDAVVEPNDQFTLALTAPVGGVVGDTSGKATILNND